MKEKNKKQQLHKTFIGFSVFMIYMILTNIQALPFQLLGIDTSTLPMWIEITYLIAYQVVLLGMIALIFKKRLLHDFQDLKENHQTYFKQYFKYWFLLLGLMMISNSIIMVINGVEIAGNEQAIRDMFQVSPIYIFISAVFIAPLLEEFVFRLGFRYMFPSKWVFILLSGLIFGSLHVINDVQVWTDLLYIIPYGIPGFIFAYILTKCDNIFVPVGLHFVHNGILMSLQFILYLFG